MQALQRGEYGMSRMTGPRLVAEMPRGYGVTHIFYLSGTCMA